MTGTAAISVARVYDGGDTGPAARLLIDRLWPRGLRKDALSLDEWIPEVAPSHDLRRWFHHESAKWEEFQARYRAELDASPEAVERCLSWCRKGPVVLLYGAKDRDHNQAVVLAAWLRAALAAEVKGGRP